MSTILQGLNAGEYDSRPATAAPESEPGRIQAWLDLLCQMLPGIEQALLVTDTCARGVPAAKWPAGCDIHEDLVSAAKLANSQKKCLTTTLSSTPGKDKPVDTLIALPLRIGDELEATLAILVDIRPSQQTVVMQILRWGEKWLGLMLRDSGPGEPRNESTRGESKIRGFARGRFRLLALALALLAGIGSVMQGSYRVTAPASLEGRIQRVVVAPFDGFIARAFARAGDTVAAGGVIAEMDTRDLLLQQQRYAAEKNEYTRQYRKALGERQQTTAHIFRAQQDQAEAQLGLLAEKIERSALVSPLDGLIISGDLSRSLGAPVETGEVLFEVAPLDEYRLIILVDEKQVADVSEGLRGELTLRALPDSALAFTVHKVSPVFEERADGNAYRVEARLDENHGALMPGMQGVAKIDIEQRSYLWIYLHELFDAVRLWAWRWLP